MLHHAEYLLLFIVLPCIFSFNLIYLGNILKIIVYIKRSNFMWSFCSLFSPLKRRYCFSVGKLEGTSRKNRNQRWYNSESLVCLQNNVFFCIPCMRIWGYVPLSINQPGKKGECINITVYRNRAVLMHAFLMHRMTSCKIGWQWVVEGRVRAMQGGCGEI